MNTKTLNREEISELGFKHSLNKIFQKHKRKVTFKEIYENVNLSATNKVDILMRSDFISDMNLNNSINKIYDFLRIQAIDFAGSFIELEYSYKVNKTNVPYVNLNEIETRLDTQFLKFLNQFIYSTKENILRNIKWLLAKAENR